jgi:hypothetical protein
VETVVVAKKPKVKLTGRDGNIFAVMARCHDVAMKAKWTEEQWKVVQHAMQKSGSYHAALGIVMDHFDVR